MRKIPVHEDLNLGIVWNLSIVSCCFSSKSGNQIICVLIS